MKRASCGFLQAPALPGVLPPPPDQPALHRRGPRPPRAPQLAPLARANGQVRMAGSIPPVTSRGVR
eukprot:9123161-Alexandrium_andersonii.AAC.1